MTHFFTNRLRLLAVAVLFSLPACREKSPEAAYQACTDVENRYNAVGEKLEKAEKDGTLTPELEAFLTEESDSLFEETKKAYANFFENQINTPYAQQIFTESRWVRRLNQDQLEAVIGKITDPTFKETEAYQTAADRLKYMKASVVGAPFINIVSKDTTGNAIELAQFIGKGKYVLLDFWASWCPDCRREMPALIELYNQFKDKNLEVAGYSLDRTPEAWKQGINDLNIPWTQMSDCEFWTSPGVKFYAIQWIPQMILFDLDGKIIARGLSIEQLSEKLNEILN